MLPRLPQCVADVAMTEGTLDTHESMLLVMPLVNQLASPLKQP